MKSVEQNCDVLRFFQIKTFRLNLEHIFIQLTIWKPKVFVRITLLEHSTGKQDGMDTKHSHNLL